WLFGDDNDLHLDEMDVENATVTVGNTDNPRLSAALLNLHNGGVLNGNGRIRSHVVNHNGTLSPGLSPGTITIVGSYTHLSGATFEAEIYADGQHDQLVVEQDPADP